MVRPIFFFGVLSSALCGFASTGIDPSDQPGISDVDYRNYGAQFTSVGSLDGAFDGSGVLVAPNWVLTAAHVADFSSSVSFSIGGNNFASAEVVLHPDYTSFDPNHANDLALIRLESAVPGIEPASIYRFGASADVLGLTGSWVGFGQGGTGLTGIDLPSELRGFTNAIDYTGDQLGLVAESFIADFDRPGGGENLSPASDPNPTPLEGNVTPLDSGGGVFATIEGVEHLVGINSFAGSVDGDTDFDYGDVSGAINLFDYYDWIETTSGVVAVPEPRHWALMVGVAMGALLWIRRGR